MKRLIEWIKAKITKWKIRITIKTLGEHPNLRIFAYEDIYKIYVKKGKIREWRFYRYGKQIKEHQVPIIIDELKGLRG